MSLEPLHGKTKNARTLKFRMEEDGLYYPCSEHKGADQLLICAFVFAYADCWFSYAAALSFHN